MTNNALKKQSHIWPEPAYLRQSSLPNNLILKVSLKDSCTHTNTGDLPGWNQKSAPYKKEVYKMALSGYRNLQGAPTDA